MRDDDSSELAWAPPCQDVCKVGHQEPRANAIWMFCPAVGMWACGRLITEGSFEVFRDGWVIGPAL